MKVSDRAAIGGFGPSDDPAVYARHVFDHARPVDRRVVPASWTAADFASITRERLLCEFWGAEVPGSGAWDSMFVGAVAAKGDLGFDVSRAAPILAAGLDARAHGDDERCVVLAGLLLEALEVAPPIPDHTAHSFGWRPAAGLIGAERIKLPEDWDERVHAGWTGQIAGAAFGTPLEGCTGEALAAVYGPINRYVVAPDTLNDDCVYELLALDVLEQHGPAVTARDFGAAWRSYLPFAWSAEWIGLENLRKGVEPPRSGWTSNPMHDWIGAQMRAMVFGLMAPGWPSEAVRLATLDASVSHARNGIDGAVFSALLTSLAFVFRDPRPLLSEVTRRMVRLPSEYAAVLRSAVEVCRQTGDADVARIELLARLEHRSWLHAFPNLAAVVVALWFGEADFTRSMSLLAKCGLDVDCNGGLVGTVLGVMNGVVPSWWASPIGGRIDTYLPDLPSVRIDEVALQTVRLAVDWRVEA